MGKSLGRMMVVLAAAVLLPVAAWALPAFPGAVGFGSETPGGRGGRVLAVTNLNDSGPGSLREACEASGPRIVVFRTGGTITIRNNIRIRHPYITIAGQTAPGDGIAIRGAAITVTTHDVVVRGLRIRVGDDPDGPHPSNRDAFQVEGLADCYNVVVDHCSFSWALDELVTFWNPGIHDITVSHCIMSEALHNHTYAEATRSQGGGPGKGPLVGPGIGRVAFIGNLFAHNFERNPLMYGTSAVVANNVVYNTGWQAAELSGSDGVAQDLSMVGNHFKKGPDYLSNLPLRLIQIQPGSRVFASDNDCREFSGCVRMVGGNDPRVGAAPIWPTGFTAQAASEVWDAVLGDVGATVPAPDPVDVRVIASVRNGTGRIIDTQSDVGGWPLLVPGTAPQDTDQDGMPDAWETARGLDPKNGADGSQDRDGDGYTNVEEYINGLLGSSPGGQSADFLAPNVPLNLRTGDYP
jgi:pectate lyase